jgi:hypothetical protein
MLAPKDLLDLLGLTLSIKEVENVTLILLDNWTDVYPFSILQQLLLDI